MKKAFAILFASLILLSGVHMTVASHICCGELAAVKISLSGQKASCGMEEPQNQAPANNTITTNCCKNTIVSCTVDNNYYPSPCNLKIFKGQTAPVSAILPVRLTSSLLPPASYFSMVGPPVSKSFTSVNQSFICVFII